MIVELDVGNSRIKWRVLDTDAGKVADMAVAAEPEELMQALARLAPPRMVRMSSVRGGAMNDAIEQWVSDHWDLPVEIARVRQECGGVRNQYLDQSRLGVDRWLAMLAAYRLAGGACIIVDSGTALTIDVVDGSGLHLGGYITPGLQLMRRSLEQNTRIRLSGAPGQESLALGNSTDSAVCNGTLAAQVSLINAAVSAMQAIDAGVKVYFAGGDAGLLAEQSIAKEFTITPSLVLDGLAIACPET